MTGQRKQTGQPEQMGHSKQTGQLEQTVLVLQGGGALGAYQAGAFAALARHDMQPDWVAGISIGAINAALICGNPVASRLDRLQEFWTTVTSGVTAGRTADLAVAPMAFGSFARAIYAEMAAASVTLTGVPGFFRPRLPLAFMPFAGQQALGVYDTTPLRATLQRLVDFDYLNAEGPRLSVGAVDVETANFAYFDSRSQRIGPAHILASAALPPSFAPVEVDGRFYWDGGLVSNTPLQFVMDTLGTERVRIFQVDLFSARDSLPQSIADVGQREKDIRYSSRTRLTTDRYRQLHRLRAAASRLAAKLPSDLRDDPDLQLLQAAGPECAITLVELIHRKQSFEGGAKDYEFTRASMVRHWAEGAADVDHCLGHADWKTRSTGPDGLQVFDLGSGYVPASLRPDLGAGI